MNDNLSAQVARSVLIACELTASWATQDIHSSPSDDLLSPEGTAIPHLLYYIDGIRRIRQPTSSPRGTAMIQKRTAPPARQPRRSRSRADTSSSFPAGEHVQLPPRPPQTATPDALARYERTLTAIMAGSAVRAARRHAGLSQAELARRARTTQPSIARLEHGHVSPTIISLDRIARALDAQLVIDFEPLSEP